MSALSDDPQISAVIPVFNGARYLAEAIDSVLLQDRRDCEIIVIDDGSTDDSAAVARAYGSKVRYLYQERSGAGAARNRGVERASGQFIAFLDADDRWMSGKLALQLAALAADPTLDVVFGHVQQGVSPDLVATRPPPGRFAPETVPGHVPGTMLARREACLRVGPFSTTWQLGEGIDWYLRAVDLQLRMRMLPDVVLWRRIHDTNQGIRQRDSRQDYVHIVKAALDRRRAAVDATVGLDAPDDPTLSSRE